MVRAVAHACVQEQPERRPNLYAPGILEPARHDPHHGVALSVEGQGPADERRVRSEATLPKPVAQHDGPLRTGVVLVREEGAPDRSLSRSEEHTSELQSPCNLVCRLLLEKKKNAPQHLDQAGRLCQDEAALV